MLKRRETTETAGTALVDQVDDVSAEPEPDQLASADSGAETLADPDVSTHTPWKKLGFSSAQELADAYRNVNTLRGRLANELGEARARLEAHDGAAPGSGPGVALLAETDMAFTERLDDLTAMIASVLEGERARTDALERKLDAVVIRLGRMGSPDA
jgi:hypothetical protein